MSNTQTILYVEDNFENRVLVRRILTAEGYRVLEAEDAYQALTLLQSHHPDLILMDINMPYVDGYDLTMRIKSMPKMAATPIIAMTANVMKGDREKSLQACCDGYIQKPVDVDELPRQISQYLYNYN
jgi:two-component system cell cycle response regulator DivK